MFSHTAVRNDFADTRALGMESALTYLNLTPLEPADTDAALAQADAADSQLLRLVIGVAGATLALALVSSIHLF